MVQVRPSRDHHGVDRDVQDPRIQGNDIHVINRRRGSVSDKIQRGGNGIMMALVAGAVVGAGVALLLAPCSGQETRGWLAHRSRKLKDKATGALAQGKEAIRQAAMELGKDGTDASKLSDRPIYGKPGAPLTRT
jgi:hypothetical protein